MTGALQSHCQLSQKPPTDSVVNEQRWAISYINDMYSLGWQNFPPLDGHPLGFASALENSDRSIRYETLNRPWGEHVHTHIVLCGKTVTLIVMLGELNIWKIRRTDALSNPYIPQIGALVPNT
jgi:hypothetical protein